MQESLDKYTGFVESQENREAAILEEIKEVSVQSTDEQERALLENLAGAQNELVAYRARKASEDTAMDKPCPHPAPFGAPIASTLASGDEFPQENHLDRPRRTRSASPGRAKPRNFRQLFGA